MSSTRITPNSKQMPINLVGGSQFGKFSKISAEKTFNCYLSTAGQEETDDSEIWLINFPAYHRVLNLLDFPSPLPTPPKYPDQLPAGEGRGIFHSIRGDLIVTVVNSQVFVLDTTFTKILLGTLNTSAGEVYMAENLHSQIAIVDGQDLWIYNYSLPLPNLTKQVGAVLDPGIGAPPDLIPSYIEYHSGFFLIGNSPNSNNSATWYVYQNATDTTVVLKTISSAFSIQTKPDFALAVKRIPARSSNVLVFGSTVCEVWTRNPGADTYQINPSISINYGCQSVGTIADGADILVWLGINEDESSVITTYDGESLRNISTDGIDALLGRIKHPEISTAMLYREDGHLFYVLTFYHEEDNLTLMYDFNTQLFFNLTNQDLDFHPARGIVYFKLKTYFISLRNAALYELAPEFTMIDENLPRTSPASIYDPNLVYEMQRMRITSNTRLADSARYIVNSLVITLEQGTDVDYLGEGASDALITESSFNPPDDIIITEQGQEILDEDSFAGNLIQVPYVPRIDLAVSKDGGITWSNYVSRTLHPLGYRQNILHWEGVGAANDICFMFRFWVNNRIVVNNGLIDVVI